MSIRTPSQLGELGESVANVRQGHAPVLREQNLREQVARLIRAEIVSGGMHPGVVYSARSLAGEFGISATPVREAMLDLVNDGLLAPRRNRGFAVTRLSERDLDEILVLRMQLEIPNVTGLAGTVGSRDAKRLGRVAADITAFAEREDVTGFLDADRTFHLGLIELVGNRRLLRLVAELRDQTRLYGLRALAAERSLPASAAEHEQILAALVGGDAPGCEALMRTHLRHTRGAWAGRTEEDPTSARAGRHPRRVSAKSKSHR